MSYLRLYLVETDRSDTGLESTRNSQNLGCRILHASSTTVRSEIGGLLMIPLTQEAIVPHSAEYGQSQMLRRRLGYG